MQHPLLSLPPPQVGVTPCTTVNCAPANIAACPIDNLSPSTDYTVTVVAQKPGFPDSLVGGPDSFKTDATPLVGSLTACTSDDGELTRGLRGSRGRLGPLLSAQCMPACPCTAIQ